MQRREFISGLGSAAAWPMMARGQQRQNVPVVGVLSPGFTDPPGLSAFYGALHDLGYTEGQNIRIERRYADWKPERFAKLAADLVRLNVDLYRRDEYLASASSAASDQYNPHCCGGNGRSCGR